MEFGNVTFGFSSVQLTTLALIFFARITDVSLGTLRIIAVSRGNRTIASLLGFFEVLVWLIPLGQVLQNLHGWVSFVVYSAGFAAGTFIGMSVVQRLYLGKFLVRIIIPEIDPQFLTRLRELRNRITVVPGFDPDGPVQVLFTIVNRNSLEKILSIVKAHQPTAFYSIEDVRTAKEYSPADITLLRFRLTLQPFAWFRKGK